MIVIISSMRNCVMDWVCKDNSSCGNFASIYVNKKDDYDDKLIVFLINKRVTSVVVSI